ncbi:MAG: DUF4783 domain-containing protein [Bacteroidetes bacterium]|nr:DUF4783 domain-containing protein [Bacteroidota bacterium]
MRIHFMVLFFLIPSLFSIPLTGKADGPDEINKLIIKAIQFGNAGELSKFFNVMIDCSIMGTEDTYSKTQGARIIQSFFDKYPVKSLKINKQGTSTDGSRFFIGELCAGDKKFRLYYLLKKNSGNYLIEQFQIKEEHD